MDGGAVGPESAARDAEREPELSLSGLCSRNAF